MAIYTKKGDHGITRVINSEDGSEIQIPKSSRRIEAIGALDELNSYIGVLKWESADPKDYFWDMSTKIQKEIFAVNATLAGTPVPISIDIIEILEEQIDRMTGRMPELRNFVYPAPTKLSAHCHYTRALTRRAERKIVALHEKEPVDGDILMFVNRLSDYWFTLARYVAFKAGFRHSKWLTGKRRTTRSEDEGLQ